MVARGRQSAQRACDVTSPDNPSEEGTAVCSGSRGPKDLLGHHQGHQQQAGWRTKCSKTYWSERRMAVAQYQCPVGPRVFQSKVGGGCQLSAPLASVHRALRLAT
eukprot:10563236-Lingulodinium_polyedra.AAC.1